MVRRFYTQQEISDGFKEMNDEIADVFFNGETHSAVSNIEMKEIVSFDDNTAYLRYELSVGYKRPVFKV